MVIRSLRRKTSRWLSLLNSWNKHPLLSTGVLFVGIILFSATMMCLLEPVTFDTYWKSLWFTMITITTVGYGDLVPKSVAGQMFAMVLMVSGIGLFAGFAGVINERIHEVALRRNVLEIVEETEEPAETLSASTYAVAHLLLEEIVALRREAAQQTAAIGQLRADLQRVRSEVNEIKKHP